MSEICVIGTGHVGLVTGACLADLGNQVSCLDTEEEKIEKLRQGIMPIFEPGLEEMVVRNREAGRLRFTTSYSEALSDVELAFIAVGTPSGSEGEADLKYMEAAVKGIAWSMKGPLIIVNKSTVPIGTGDWVAEIVEKHKGNDAKVAVVSNPEFLREGSAVHDFMNPDRVILGSLDRAAAEKVAELYRPLQTTIIITDLRTAEMIKYASNAYLATKISFINEIASICERLGVDVKEVARGMGLDKRIGPLYLEAGLGWGGWCLPKDVRALAHMAAIHGSHPQLLRAVMEINHDQRRRVIGKLRDALGSLRERTIGIMGLAFKPNTDDIREAPSLDIIHLLRSEGAFIKAYDPVAMEGAKEILSDIEWGRDPYDLAQGCDALVLVTEWNEFKQLDMARIKSLMRQPVLMDGRNIYDPERMAALGFTYLGVGRGKYTK